MWHWLQVSPVCRTNDGTLALATEAATTPSAASETTTFDHRICCLLPQGVLREYYKTFLQFCFRVLPVLRLDFCYFCYFTYFFFFAVSSVM
jgi:hypothetical protein